MIRKLALMVMVLGIVSLIAGGAFIGLAVQKNNYIVSSLRAQQVTLGLTKDQIAAGQLVDSAQTAQVAADTLATHLKSIAPTYGALMAKSKTGKYDPTDPVQLDYAQGLNMENSFNTVILGFGVIQETMGTGAVMMVLGLAVGVLGFGLFRLSR